MSMSQNKSGILNVPVPEGGALRDVSDGIKGPEDYIMG